MSESGFTNLPFAIAHRGGNEKFPENSLEAFADALELGYKRLETDVHIGADGDLLAVHGLTIDGREVDEGGDYVHVNGEAILIAGLNKVARKTLEKEGISIPTLSELLELTENKGIYWSIDAKKPEAVDPLLQVLAARKLFSTVCLGSFVQATTDLLRAGAPDGTQTALTQDELLRLFMATFNPDDKADLPKYSRAQVPTTFSGREITTQAFIDTAHRHGVPVDVWTINEPDEMNLLIDRGVDGIFTDKLRVLKTVLAARKLWSEQQD